jgi:uncharacterized metal-binding protein YceD (DUF177 family)
MTKAPYSHPFRVVDLAGRKPTRFALTPDAAERAAIAQELDLLDLPEVALRGELRPIGRRDWHLTGDLSATVIQPCILTLAPVRTAIREPVMRRYLSEMPEPDGDEVEMPEDDSAEPLPAVIDAGAVLIEALALALPLYPRAPDAALDGAQVTEPGKAALRDEDARPFANLSDLLKKRDT